MIRFVRIKDHSDETNWEERYQKYSNNDNKVKIIDPFNLYNTIKKISKHL